MQEKRAGHTRDNLKKTERPARSDKRIRVAPSLDRKTHGFLVQLAAACSAGGKDCSWSKVAETAIQTALRSPEFVKWMQEQHKTPLSFRIVPLFDSGEMTYLVGSGSQVNN